MKILLQARDLGLRWPSGTVQFECLSASIVAGRAFVLRGSNGSGKTTLLKMLNGLLAPTSGKIMYDGADIANPLAGKRLRSETVFVHDVPFMLPGTLRDNIRHARKFRNMADDQAVVESVLGALCIGHLGDERAARLSAGELKRAGLARALALETRVLFVDEPLANLDSLSRDLVWSALDGYVRNGGTLVVTTHDAVLENLYNADVRELDGMKNGGE